MTKNPLFDAIFYRKSIRKYNEPLSAAALAELQKFASEITPLDEKIKYEFSFLSTDEVKNLLLMKAPQYICLYSEKKENYLMNAGFLLQQINLYLSANELGSCWLGMAKPTKRVQAEKNGLKFVIMLAFGNSAEPVHRADRSEFKRNHLSSISNITGLDEMLEPVRLAPSGVNTQPWFLSGNADEITVSRKMLNLIQEHLYGKMNQIDIGIALCHLWLSLNHQGKRVAFDFAQGPAPSGYTFMTKVMVERT